MPITARAGALIGFVWGAAVATFAMDVVSAWTLSSATPPAATAPAIALPERRPIVSPPADSAPTPEVLTIPGDSDDALRVTSLQAPASPSL